MGRRLLFLNILLLAGVGLLAQRLVVSWQEFKEDPPRVQSVESRPVEVVAPSGMARAEPLSQFLSIPERDLFSQQRAPQASAVGDEEAEQAPEIAKDPELLSVFSLGGEKEAVINVFEGRRAKQATKQNVKIGDSVLGYTVTKIEDTYAVLTWKDQEKVVELAPVQASGKKTQTSALAVNIITIGNRGAAVETTSPAEAAEQSRGVEIGTVGTRNMQGTGRGGAMQGGARGQLGNQQNSRLGGGLGGSNRGMSQQRGLGGSSQMGGSRSSPFNRSRRP
jgi:hypothetical protein